MLRKPSKPSVDKVLGLGAGTVDGGFDAAPGVGLPPLSRWPKSPSRALTGEAEHFTTRLRAFRTSSQAQVAVASGYRAAA